jgi:hypothetical protein
MRKKKKEEERGKGKNEFREILHTLYQFPAMVPPFTG